MSARFSYSRIEQYNNCPYAYNIKYNEGHYFNVENAAAPYGQLIHKILELEATAIKNGRPINYESLKRDFVELNLPKRNKYDRTGDLFGIKILEERYPKDWHNFNTKSGQSYATKAKEFLERGIYDFPNYCAEHPELEIIGAEIGFEFEYRGYVFMGFIDRVMKVKGEDQYIIFDIKTKDSPYTDAELTSPTQHAIYNAAIKNIYGKDIQIENYYELPTLHLLQHAGTKGFEKRCFNKIDKILNGIEAGDWRANPSPLCFFCPLRRKPDQPEEAKPYTCPYYSLWTPENRKCFDVKNEWRGPEHHEEVMKNFKEQCAMEDGLITNGPNGYIEF